MNGKKDRSKTMHEIHNSKEMNKKYEYITVYEGQDMSDFYKTIKNMSISRT